jgi:signal transduction histidine kinase
MKQVINNLVMNARDAIPQGGRIYVRAENVRPGEGDILNLKKGKYVRVYIEDNDVGIPEEHLGKVFEPYFTTKGMGADRGTGLGLSVCHLIINKHGGHVEVKSEVRVG